MAPDGVTSAATRAELRLIGPFGLQLAGRAVPVTSRRAQALLAYLARRDGQAAPRESLIALLWADSPDEQARASLRQVLSGLRRLLGDAVDEVLVAEGAAVGLARGAVASDADALARAGEDPETLSTIEAACRGAFLEGFGALTPEFDRWLDAERAHLAARVAALRLKLCDLRLAAGQMDEAVAVAHRLIADDPLQEQVHRRLMRAYLRLHRHDAALRQFDQIKALLASELGVQPEAETLALAAEVRRARQSRSAPPPALPGDRPASPGEAAPVRPVIAVLPFRALSGGEEASLFGEALAEEIIVELAREAGIRVLSRATSFQVEETPNSLEGLSEAVGLGFAVTGSVRMVGQGLRVTAQLVQARGGATLWADRFDRDMREVFLIQSEIARTVTATVVGRITDAEAEATAGRPLESLAAAALIARGQRHFRSFSGEGFLQASACFQRAIALEPAYARAHGLLAIAQLYRRWSFELRSDIDDILPDALRAVELDDRDAKGHCALGLGYLIRREFDRSAHHFEIGLRRNPGDDLLLLEYGRFLIYVDQPEAALEKVREAIRLNPYHPNYYWHLEARCLHTLGRLAEALEVFGRVENPPFWVYVYLEMCHRSLGDTVRAEAARRAYLAVAPDMDLDRFRATFPFRNSASAQAFFAALDLHREVGAA